MKRNIILILLLIVTSTSLSAQKKEHQNGNTIELSQPSTAEKSSSLRSMNLFENINTLIANLIWPLIFLLIYIRHKDLFYILFERIATKFDLIKAPGGFEARIGEETAEIVTDIEHQNISEPMKELRLNSILSQAKGFSQKNLETRKRRANIIFEDAKFISGTHMDELISSKNEDLIIAGLIVLNSKLQSKQIEITKGDVRSTFIKLNLTHPNSLVRFRSAEVIKNNKMLRIEFKPKLSSLKNEEENRAVRQMLDFAIKNN